VLHCSDRKIDGVVPRSCPVSPPGGAPVNRSVNRHEQISRVALRTLVFSVATLFSGLLFSAKAQTFVVSTFGGALANMIEEHWVKPFCEERGIDYVMVSPTDYGKLTAMVEAGHVEWDIADVGANFIWTGAQRGVLEPIDYNVVNTSGVPKDFVQEYGVAYTSYSFVLAWNTNRISGEAPTSWADFWDVEKFPGPRSLFDDPFSNIEIALLADGLSTNEIYPLTEEKIDRAFAKLDEIYPHVRVWWSSYAESPQLLADGEVVMASGSSGRLFDIIDEGAPVGFTYEQGIFAANAFVVPKGAPNTALAMEFINFVLDPANQAAAVSEVAYGPVNQNAFDYISDERALELNTAPQWMALQVPMDEQWWAQERAGLQRRWLEWKLGH